VICPLNVFFFSDMLNVADLQPYPFWPKADPTSSAAELLEDVKQRMSTSNQDMLVDNAVSTYR
jgi:hypothetical protein